MTDKKQIIDKERRNFLRSSTVVGAGAIVASGIPSVTAAMTPEPIIEQKNEGYRLTQHIKDYYKSAAS